MSVKHEKDLAKQFYTVMYRTRRFEEEVFEFYKRGLTTTSAPLTGATATWWPGGPT